MCPVAMLNIVAAQVTAAKGSAERRRNWSEGGAGNAVARHDLGGCRQLGTSADDRADFTPGDMIERDQVAACR
jgi:hypothetical protein